MFSSLELFAGAGGLALGVARAGFQTVDLIESNPWCCATLSENSNHFFKHSNAKLITPTSVIGLDYTLLRNLNLDLIAGGPPCQPFSFGGKHLAQDDNRNMFPEAIRAIRELRPKAFIFENVPGLAREKFAKYLEYLQLKLGNPDDFLLDKEDWRVHMTRLKKNLPENKKSLRGYSVEAHLIEAANFGVPQRRKRLIFVGIRNDLDVYWSFPQESHSIEGLAWDQVHGDYWDRHKVPLRERYVDKRLETISRKIAPDRPDTDQLPWVTVRDALADLEDPELFEGSPQHSDHIFKAGAKQYKGHTGSPWDLPAKTLKAGVNGVPGGENMLQKPNGSVRYFTIRECARLQTFPDNFNFHGTWTQTVKQLGNAVPVTLAETVSRSIFDALNSRPKQSTSPPPIK